MNTTVERAFRPWNVDSLATIIRKNADGSLVIAYDHEPERHHHLSKREAGVIGREVTRANF